MSGFPNMEEIEELRDLLRFSDTDAEAIRFARNEMLRLQNDIREANERRAAAEKRIQELMDKMDCSAPGNNGYENRVRALLVGLSRLK